MSDALSEPLPSVHPQMRQTGRPLAWDGAPFGIEGPGLETEAALDGILTAAVELFGASYGALIDSPSRTTGWRAVHQHFGDEEIDHLEAGISSAGVPDELFADSGPVMIDDLAWAGAVPTGAAVRVLAVPIRAAGAVAGALVVAAAGRPDFTDDDARLLETLATAAAIALASAALRTEVLRREAWSDTSAETVSALLTGQLDAPPAVLASRVRLLAAADFACVLRMDGAYDALRVDAISGRDDLRVGDRVPIGGSVPGEAIASGQPRLVPSGLLPVLRSTRSPARPGPMMLAPMVSDEAAIGVVVVGRHAGSPAFSPSDLDLLAGFVGHTTVALQLVEARADRERMILLEDRARIARDLHDTVIQQLFAAGLELRATAAEAQNPRIEAGVRETVTLIDGAIGRIRTAVLAISPDPARGSLRHRILDVIGDLSRRFAQPPELLFDGPIEWVARGDLGEDLVAVVREALTNVARHASADRAGVLVAVIDGRVRVEVWDDGRGMPAAPSRSGLANLEERAVLHGGTFTIDSASGTTRAVWTVPYGERSEA